MKMHGSDLLLHDKKSRGYGKLVFFLLVINFLFGIDSALAKADKFSFHLEIPIMGLELCMLVFAVYFRSIQFQLITFLGLAFTGIDYVLFLSPFILLPKIIFSKNRFLRVRLSGGGKYVVVFLLYAVLLALVFNSRQSLIINAIFWFMTFGSAFVYYCFYSGYRFETSFIKYSFRVTLWFIILQMVLVLFDIVISANLIPGDSGIGSLKDANKVGFYELFLILYLHLVYVFDSRKSISYLFSLKNLAVTIVLLLLLYYADAKTILLFLGIGVILLMYMFYLFSLLFSRFRNVPWVRLATMLLVLTIAFANGKTLANFLLSKMTRQTVTVDDLMTLYVAGKEHSLKYQMYNRVFPVMQREHPVEWIVGTGPGTFGSRASNTLSYDVLYKGEQKIPFFIPPGSSRWVKTYMKDLWTEDIANTMKNVSSTLAFPFSGIASVKAEFGIPGLILFILICLGFFKELTILLGREQDIFFKRGYLCLAVFWICLPLLMVFDNFQEKPQIMFTMVTLTVLILGRSTYNNDSPTLVHLKATPRNPLISADH